MDVLDILVENIIDGASRQEVERKRSWWESRRCRGHYEVERIHSLWYLLIKKEDKLKSYPIITTLTANFTEQVKTVLIKKDDLTPVIWVQIHFLASLSLAFFGFLGNFFHLFGIIFPVLFTLVCQFVVSLMSFYKYSNEFSVNEISEESILPSATLCL